MIKSVKTKVIQSKHSKRSSTISHVSRLNPHLIRKALAITQAVDREAKQIAQWLLDEMRELIHQIATAASDNPEDPGTIRLQKVTQLAQANAHVKLKALANEILNDWDAVVAFVSNPQLPVIINHSANGHCVMR